MTERDRDATDGDEPDPSPEELDAELDAFLDRKETGTESPHDFVRRRMREIEEERKKTPDK